jgi:glycosyltransferase involved in cell wall biosynthesis
MNILFYSPVNFRCRDLESLAKKFHEKGHKVFFLSQCNRGAIHFSLDKIGIETYDGIKSNGLIINLIDLILFSRKHSIDLLFSHLEPTNFVSVIAQLFIKVKVIIFRHHINEAKLYGFDKSFAYRVTYKLANNIITVSEEGKQYMIKEEKISERKIHHINLGYDFSLYDEPDLIEVDRIKTIYKKDLLLVTVGRLTEYKRQHLSIELVRRANLGGLDTSLLLLGVGEKEAELRNLVAKYSLEDKVFFLGFVQNTINYLAAADFLVHPSVLESSCVTVKEAGLVMLPVIVCNGVGDFGNYMKNEMNGIVLEPNYFVDSALKHLMMYKENPLHYKTMGRELHFEILSRFSIEKTINYYSQFETCE